MFAEDYRVLNERRAGLPETPWEVVDDSLYPYQTALDLLAQDVTTPWTGATTTSYRVASARDERARIPRPDAARRRLHGDDNLAGEVRFTPRIVDLASGKVLAADATPCA